MGRNINFDGNLGDNIEFSDLNNARRGNLKKIGVKNTNTIYNKTNAENYILYNKAENNLNKLENDLQRNEFSSNNLNANLNVHGFLYGNRIEFTSESEDSDSSKSYLEKQESDRYGLINHASNTAIKAENLKKNSSMIDSDRPTRNRKYTIQLSNSLNMNSEIQEQNPTKKNFCCTCTRSRCLKRYCECYANNVYCEGCDCQNCYNLPKFKELIKKSSELNNQMNKQNFESQRKEEQKQEEILCNCTKSNCRKKYCECFKAGEGCKELCRCINCKNEKKMSANSSHKLSTTTMPYSFDLSHDVNLLSKVTQDQEKRKAARNPKNFILEGTSVYISNQDISVTFRKEILNKHPRENFLINSNDLQEKFQAEDDSNFTEINLENSNNNSSNKKHSNIFDNNTESVISSNNYDFKNISEKKSHPNFLKRESDPKSAEKNLNTPHLETPTMIRKRNRIKKADSVTKSSSSLFHTPLFATNSTQKYNRKKVNLDKRIVKNLDKYIDSM